MAENITKKFGYEAMIEKHAIRAQLKASGITGPMALHFQTERQYCANHANDPSYRETSSAFSARAHNAAAKGGFTPAELAYMADIFADSNNPLARKIALKAKALEGGE